MTRPRSRFDPTSGTAVITGAASGIGEQLAMALARRGSALALVDRDAAGLERVATAAARSTKRPVATHVVDLADDDATHRLSERLAQEHPDAVLLVNNAGVGLAGTFEEATEEEFDWLLAINLRAVVTLTRALLPVLRGNPGAHLVLISSVYGLIAPAGQVAYVTSKFAVRGFGEALRSELAGAVGVTVVHPGGVRTRIADTARIAAAVPVERAEADRRAYGRLLRYPPERVAERVLAAVERRRPRVIVGTGARAADLLGRLAPTGYQPLIGAAARRVRPRFGGRSSS